MPVLTATGPAPWLEVILAALMTPLLVSKVVEEPNAEGPVVVGGAPGVGDAGQWVAGALVLVDGSWEQGEVVLGVGGGLLVPENLTKGQL